MLEGATSLAFGGLNQHAIVRPRVEEATKIRTVSASGVDCPMMGLQRSLPGTRDRVIAKRPGRAKPGRQGKGKEKAKDVGAEAVLVEVKRRSSERSHYKQAVSEAEVLCRFLID